MVSVTPWTEGCRTCASGRPLCVELPACFERHPAPAAAAPHSQPANSGGIPRVFRVKGLPGWVQVLDPCPRVCDCYSLSYACLGVEGVTGFGVTVKKILEAWGFTASGNFVLQVSSSLDSASDPSTSDSWLARRLWLYSVMSRSSSCMQLHMKQGVSMCSSCIQLHRYRKRICDAEQDSIPCTGKCRMSSIACMSACTAKIYVRSAADVRPGGNSTARHGVL